MLERDLDQPPFEGQQAEILLEVIPAHHVEDDIDSCRTDDASRFFSEIVRAVVDHVVGADRLRERSLVTIAYGRNHGRAPRLGDLDRRVTDAAAAAMDQDGLARTQAAALDDIGPDREEIFRNCGGMLEIEFIRRRQAVRGRNDAVPGITAARCQCAHRVADLPFCDRGAERRNVAGDLQPQDRRCARRRRVASLALDNVGPVDAGVADGDQDVVITGNRNRTFGDGEGFRAAAGAV